MLKKWRLRVRDGTRMTSVKIVQFSRPPTPLAHLRPNFFHPLELEPPVSNDSPPAPCLSPNDNQSIKRKHNPSMTTASYQVLLSDRLLFSAQLINLVWLFFDFFLFSWSLTSCFAVPLYSCVCSCPKISRNSHFQYSFCNQPVAINKLRNNDRTVHVNEQNQNKNKTMLHHIQINHAFYYCSI